jgi:hypothetical protein
MRCLRRLIHDRWIDKYTERRVGARRSQDDARGDDGMTTMTEQTTQVSGGLSYIPSGLKTLLETGEPLGN